MSWKKRNQKLRGPKVSKKVRVLRIYPNPGAGTGFYADPRHKQRIFQENGVWYHQSLENNDGIRFKLYDPNDRWSLPAPPIWSATALMMAISHRAAITRLSELRSKRKARIARERMLKAGYKAASDAIKTGGFDPRVTTYLKPASIMKLAEGIENELEKRKQQAKDSAQRSQAS